MGQQELYTHLRLDPLGSENAREMLDAVLGGGVELAALKRLISDKTEGNPLFMIEMVQLMFNGGVVANHFRGREGRAESSSSVRNIQCVYLSEHYRGAIIAALYLRRVRVAEIACTQIPFLEENDTVEFKSSLRWDYKQQKPNTGLFGDAAFSGIPPIAHRRVPRASTTAKSKTSSTARSGVAGASLTLLPK